MDIADQPGTDILSLLPEAIRFIHAARAAGGAVFVHCRFGASRSATVVAAYLLCQLPALGLAEALAHIRAVRPTMEPIQWFLTQLQEFEHSDDCAGLRNELTGPSSNERLLQQTDQFWASKRLGAAGARM